MNIKSNIRSIVAAAWMAFTIPALGSDPLSPNDLFVAHWNSGLSADYSAGSPTPTASQASISTVSPKFGLGGLSLTNSGDYLSYNSAGNFNPTNGTVELWIKPSVDNYLTAAAHGIFRTSPDGANQWNLRVAGGGLQFVLQESGTPYFAAPALSPWAKDTWHHVAVTWGSGGIQLYADGVNVASNPFTGFSPAGADLQLGTIFGNQASATFDELLISADQRSATQILADFNRDHEFAPEPGVSMLFGLGAVVLARLRRHAKDA
jgi:hypothetical protein